jgi:hypothetical protein
VTICCGRWIEAERTVTGAEGAGPGVEGAGNGVEGVGQGAEGAVRGAEEVEPAAPDDVLREELARLLDNGGAPDADDALDVLWIARLSGLDPVDWSLLGNGTDPTAPPPPVDPSPPADPDDHPAPDPDLDSEPPSARLHLPGGTDGTAPVRPGGAHVVRVAQPRALPDVLALTRALRPLRQTVPSARAHTLDVDATAAASGDTGLLLPVLSPAVERRFSVDLLIDTGTTMTVWHRLAGELRTVLARHGAFADVRAWALNTDGPEPTLAPFRSGAQAASPTRRWKQALADPAGRRMVLILTDGVGPAWYGTELCAALADWSVRRPVAALQVLPSRLWHRTALRAAPVRARGAEAHRATVEVRSSGPLPGVARGRAGAQDRARIRWLPVLEVDGDWLAPWARLVSGRTTDWVPLRAAPLTVTERPSPTGPADEPSTPAEWIERFEEGYSPEAFSLVRLLAAAPLSLPVMRLVQRTMLPSSTPMHLAEIFLSGLLVRRTPAEPGEDPDGVLYDFRAGVRDVLLDRLTRTESLRVLEKVIDGVSERVAATFGGVTDFGALVTAVEENGGLDGLELPEGSRAFAEVALAVIGGVGGDYGEVAAKLGRRRASAPGADEPAAADPVPEEREQRRRRERRLSWRRLKRGFSVTVGSFELGAESDGDDGESGRDQGRVPSRIPARTPFYVDRAETPEVMAVLRMGRPPSAPHYPFRESATCLIDGAAGVGKTELAAHCAEELAPDFTVVRWIRAHDREAVLEDLAAFADDLGIGRYVEQGPFPARRLLALRDYLVRHPGWLLVYDDVTAKTFEDGPGDPMGWRTLALPPEGYGSLLVTLREGTGSVEAEHRTVTLTDLSHDAAVEYLEKALARDRGKLWKTRAELADLVKVRGTRPPLLGMLAMVIEGSRQPVNRLVTDALLGREEVRRFLRSLVWITKDGAFVSTGVAVRPDVVLTSGIKTPLGVFRVHGLDGRAVPVASLTKGGGAPPGLIAMRLYEGAFPGLPLSAPDQPEMAAAWYTPKRRSKPPECSVAPASSEAHPPDVGAAVCDRDGNLHSVVVPDGKGRSVQPVTPDIIATFMTTLEPRAAQVRDRTPEPARADVPLMQEPLFYLSYARSSRESRTPVQGFFDDLCGSISELTAMSMPGYGVDLGGEPPGLRWDEPMKRALATAQVFVPLYSEDYFRNEWCGREWDAFSRRLSGSEHAAIVPLPWTPLASVPWVARSVPLRFMYHGGGVHGMGLMELRESRPRDYRREVGRIAENIVSVARETLLPPCDPSLLDDLRNAFDDEEPR